MRTAIILLLAATLIAADGNARDKGMRAKCAQTKEKIGKLRSRMRQGYSARQGIRFDERMRELKQKRRKYCR